MSVIDFVLENFPKTIRDPKFNGKNLPNQYMTPCAEGIFQNFYYWDTYFINVGLIALNDLNMVRNNLNIMKHFVDLYGFVPNADHLLKGSQPPLFTRGVYDLYLASKDIEDIKKYAYSCYKELQFWENKRQTKIHLNQYKCSWNDKDCLEAFEYFKSRVDGLNEIEEKIDPIELTRDFYAIAESGWDINSRFMSNGNRFAIHEFACLDLNCILYDAENKLSELFNIINEKQLSDELNKKAEERKSLINKYNQHKNQINMRAFEKNFAAARYEQYFISANSARAHAPRLSGKGEIDSIKYYLNNPYIDKSPERSGDFLRHSKTIYEKHNLLVALLADLY